MHHEIENISYLSRKYSQQIKKLTAPLLHQFGITYFARQSVSNDGYWEILGNSPAWLDHSAAKEFYNVDPSLLHPDHYEPGLLVNAAHTAPEFLQAMTNESLTRYDIANTLCILGKTPTGCEWYFFAASAKNTKIIDTYITKINLIYQYIQYFKTAAKNLLQRNLDYRINIATLKNTPFQSNNNIISLSSSTVTDEYIINFQERKVTPREKDCLIYLIGGKTIKETAKLLHISPRTVEEYLQRLKQKTGCKYKRELISLFQKKIIF